MKTDFLSTALLYISTSSVQTKDTVAAIQQLLPITRNIELSGGCLYDKNLFKNLMNIKQQEKINFLLHSYFPPPQERFILNFADISEETRSFIKETMRFVNSLDIDYYSIHAGFKKKFNLEKELLFESDDKKVFMQENIADNLKWFKMQFPDKKMALENLYPNNNIKCCFMMHIDEIVSMMDDLADIYLLLDLGHLKISSRILGFNYLEAAELLFEKYGNRILEIHLSENSGMNDDHWILNSNSIQYMIIEKYANLITQNKINVTIESRGSTLDELLKCLLMVKNAISNTI